MTATSTTPRRDEAASTGLPPDQVHAWLAQVQDDVRRVRARLEYLRAEESRLVAQQQLLAELLASSGSTT